MCTKIVKGRFREMKHFTHIGDHQMQENLRQYFPGEEMLVVVWKMQ